jgi:hypothetical protein
MLHEVPPQLHRMVMEEMKRVGERIVILERPPSIPSDTEEEKLQDLADSLAVAPARRKSRSPRITGCQCSAI